MKRWRFAFLLAIGTVLARAESDIDRAAELYRSHRYPEARVILERIVAADPRNAAACHYLGMAIDRAGGPQSPELAVVWLEKAVRLDPGTALYLGDYGGVCFQLADRRRSYFDATRGRNAMLRAVEIDPNYLDAREGLMQFYARAPWPLGSSTLAREQAEAIASRDARRGLRAYLILGRAFEKVRNRDAARTAYASALALSPADPEARAALARLGPKGG